MDQQVTPSDLPTFEAQAFGGRLVSQELHDTRPSTVIFTAAPPVSPPWTPSMDARRGRRRLEMPAALTRLLSSDAGALLPSSAPEDAELECYLIEGSAYRRQRLPFGQGHLARGLARREADALWGNYMALDAGQKACVDRLLRRKARTSTRPRTCVAITPFAGHGAGDGAAERATATPETATEATATPSGEAVVTPAAKSPSFLVFLAVGRPVAPVRFRDPLGRRFEFSFELCRTWAGMEDLLLDCFPRGTDDADAHSIDARVRSGHYDVLGPDGQIVLPMVWETLVRPGWRVSMVLWPEIFAAWGRPPPLGPHARAVHPGGLWQKALGVLRAPFERVRHFPHPLHAAPVTSVLGAERQREAPRETLVLRQPRVDDGVEACVSYTEASRPASPARFAATPEGFTRHSSDMPGSPPSTLLGDNAGVTRSWYVTSLPQRMALQPVSASAAPPRRSLTARESGRRLSPVYSAPPPDEHSIDGSVAAAGASSSSKASSYPPSGTGHSEEDVDDDDDGGTSRSSSIPDCGSEALETASLGKGIDDLLGRWTSARADPACDTEAGGKARRGKVGEGLEPNGE